MRSGGNGKEVRVGGYIALIAALIVITGFFAAAEMALVSLRESQLKHLTTRGKRGQALARLTANPNRFLSAIQVMVTLAGFLSAAFGESALSRTIVPVLEGLGMSAAVADVVALILITVVISYFSIVLGELTAKRLAMQRAESVAMTLGPLVDAVARFMRPIVWFLGVSTNVAVRLLGGDPRAGRQQVTDEEIRSLVSTSTTLGAEERRIVDDVFAAGERSLREVMVPRTEVDFLAGDMPAYKAIREVQGAPHSRYPVTRGSVDDIAGFVHVRDLLGLDPEDRHTPVAQLVRPVAVLPETVKVLRALTHLRRSSTHLAIVRDEYGGTAGIVTMEDLVEELIGEITDEYDVVADEPVSDGDLVMLDGLLALDDFAERTGLVLPAGAYDTLAGFVVARQGRLPRVGDSVPAELGLRGFEDALVPVELEVMELDGRRAARIGLRRLPVPEPVPEGGG